MITGIRMYIDRFFLTFSIEAFDLLFFETLNLISRVFPAIGLDKFIILKKLIVKLDLTRNSVLENHSILKPLVFVFKIRVFTSLKG